MDSDNENTTDLTTANIEEIGNKHASLEWLPEISRKKYETTYRLFMEWRSHQEDTSFSENVLMTYFEDLSKKFKSSTLWTQYSMLRTTLIVNHNIDITNYLKLKAFLKKRLDGYQPKKSKVFTSSEINKFIKEAPDEDHLATKVALIMGVVGACRKRELYNIKTTNLNDLGSAVLVTIPDARMKVVRSFTITGKFYEIYKKYADLRPQNVNDPWFFLNYHKGKCNLQRIGINKVGAMGKQIARYLKLPNPELYTAHCFCRSFATVVMDGDGEVISLKRRGRWKPNSVSEGYVDESIIRIYDAASKVGHPNDIRSPISRMEILEHQENHDEHEHNGLDEEDPLEGTSNDSRWETDTYNNPSLNATSNNHSLKRPSECTPPSLPLKKERLDDNGFQAKYHEISSDEDECYAFIKYVCSKLRQYTPEVRSRVQHEVSTILLKADLGEFQNFHYNQLNTLKRIYNNSPTQQSLPSPEIKSEIHYESSDALSEIEQKVDVTDIL